MFIREQSAKLEAHRYPTLVFEENSLVAMIMIERAITNTEAGFVDCTIFLLQ